MNLTFPLLRTKSTLILSTHYLKNSTSAFFTDMDTYDMLSKYSISDIGDGVP